MKLAQIFLNTYNIKESFYLLNINSCLFLCTVDIFSLIKVVPSEIQVAQSSNVSFCSNVKFQNKIQFVQLSLIKIFSQVIPISRTAKNQKYYQVIEYVCRNNNIWILYPVCKVPVSPKGIIRACPQQRILESAISTCFSPLITHLHS